MTPKIATLLLLPTLWASSAVAAEEGFRPDWNGTLYGYSNARQLRSDSVLNPQNQIAHLAERSNVAELRLNLKAESEQFRLTARPILSARKTYNGFGHGTDSDAYLSQWQLRARVAEGWHLAAGRDVLNWGPAQFRSPSSPFYFDNGRSDPMRELVGMDSLKASWTPDRQTSASLVHIVRSGLGPSPSRASESDDRWRNGWLAKFDRRGKAWALGLVAAGSPQQADFFGAYLQATVSDALMLYGEAGSSKLINKLQSPSDASQPFIAQPVSSRQTTVLLGSAYTFENGQSLAAEYLHNGHGLSTAQEDAYFSRARTQPGMALGLRPPLLGRDYLHLVWQSNLMDDAGYWRLMASRNLTDGSSELAAYGEYVLNHRMTAYLLAVLPQGNAQQEFSSLFQNSLTLGLKIALP